DDVENQKELTKEEKQKEQENKKKKPLVVKRLKYKSDAKGFHDDKRTQLILFDVKNETFTQLTNFDADHVYQDMSPDGNLVLFSANLSGDADYELKNDLYTVNVATKEINKLTSG